MEVRPVQPERVQAAASMVQHAQWGAAVHGQFLGHAAVEEAFQEPRVPVHRSSASGSPKYMLWWNPRADCLPIGLAMDVLVCIACCTDVPESGRYATAGDPLFR